MNHITETIFRQKMNQGCKWLFVYILFCLFGICLVFFALSCLFYRLFF